MTKKIIFGFIIIATLFVFGCSNGSNEVVEPPQKIESNSMETKKIVEPKSVENTEDTSKFTMEEISLHNQKGDCWLLISGKVYDVSEYTPSHPGGDAIFQGCGIDSTSLYETRPMGSGTPHSQKARNYLTKFYIGEYSE